MFDERSGLPGPQRQEITPFLFQSLLRIWAHQCALQWVRERGVTGVFHIFKEAVAKTSRQSSTEMRTQPGVLCGFSEEHFAMHGRGA